MQIQKRPYGRILTLVLVLVLSFTSIALAEPQNLGQKNLEEQIKELKIIIKYIQESYVGQVTEEQLMQGAFRGIFQSLDPHSNYFTYLEYKKFFQETSGTFSGVGLSVGTRDGKIVVISPIEGTPAAKAGLKAGDEITTVDDKNVVGDTLENVVTMMRGEAGTKLKLGVKRQDKSLSFTMKREIIKINPVSYKILDNHIGYVKIVEFNQNTSENLEKAMAEFEKKQVRGIILDLRNNPGGLLDEAVNVSEFFVPKGPVVHIDYKDNIRRTYSSMKEGIHKPLVVLVNEGSASASEIVAGAIQDTKAGTILGTKTYGKGTVQTIMPIQGSGGIKLTVAKYLTPKERLIDGVGIVPDIIVSNPDNEMLEEVKDLVPMIEEAKPTLGDKGLNVYGAQQRLVLLGYGDVVVTGKLDEATFEAIQKFQKAMGLYDYGTLDYGTRDKLNEEIQKLLENGQEDLQLKKAIEIIKK